MLWPQTSALFYYLLKLGNLHSAASLVAQSQRCARPWCTTFEMTADALTGKVSQKELGSQSASETRHAITANFKKHM